MELDIAKTNRRRRINNRRNTMHKPNCELTVHFSRLKAELFAELGLVRALGFEEGQRFVTEWGPGFFTARIYPHPNEGRQWKRRSAVAGGPLVGQARLRLVDPRLMVAPRFQPTKKMPCWVGWIGNEVVIEFAHSLEEAGTRAVAAHKRARTKVKGSLHGTGSNQ